MNKRERMYEEIRTHGENLNRIFDTGLDAVALCKKLRRIEVEAERYALSYCNDAQFSNSHELQDLDDMILQQVDKVLHFTEKNIPVFYNKDPRGYALKIDDEWVRANEVKIYQDWGGYGILAPDFSERS